MKRTLFCGFLAGLFYPIFLGSMLGFELVASIISDSFAMACVLVSTNAAYFFWFWSQYCPKNDTTISPNMGVLIAVSAAATFGLEWYLIWDTFGSAAVTWDFVAIFALPVFPVVLLSEFIVVFLIKEEPMFGWYREWLRRRRMNRLRRVNARLKLLEEDFKRWVLTAGCWGVALVADDVYWHNRSHLETERSMLAGKLGLSEEQAKAV